jgi:predicted ester cyclase
LSIGVSSGGLIRGDIEGLPATGKKVEMSGFSIIRVENGKVAETWGARDLLSLYQQLGFELRPKEEK